MKFTLVFLLLYFSFSYCQQKNEIDTKSNNSIALYYGYGFKTGLIANTNFYYTPTIFIAEFTQKIVNKKKIALSLRFSAEYNDVVFCESYVSNPCFDQQNKNYGLNFSFDVSTKISEKINAYSFIGTGAHNLETKLGRQAKGIIFSDVLSVGMTYNFHKRNYFIDFRYGLRHMSNAGIARPNVSIENNIYYVGIGKNL